MKNLHKSNPMNMVICFAFVAVNLNLVYGQETRNTKPLPKTVSSETLKDIAKDLQNRMQGEQPSPKGTDVQTIDRKGQDIHTTDIENKAISDSAVLEFLNLGLKELRQPLISMEELGSFDLQKLPKEYFIVVDRQGDQQVLSEWISGEFLRIREAKWECWRPTNKLLKENIISGKMILSEPNHKFIVLLMNDGDMRSALLKINDRVWAVNISRRDGFSPVIPLVAEELFYENLRVNNK